MGRTRTRRPRAVLGSLCARSSTRPSLCGPAGNGLHPVNPAPRRSPSLASRRVHETRDESGVGRVARPERPASACPLVRLCRSFLAYFFSSWNPTKHTHTHACAHARTCTHTHTHTHATPQGCWALFRAHQFDPLLHSLCGPVRPLRRVQRIPRPTYPPRSTHAQHPRAQACRVPSLKRARSSCTCR